MKTEDPIYKEAKKRMLAKKGFYKHLGAYIAVGIFFMGLNLASYLNGEGDIWFQIPMLGWGIGLLIHYFSTFGLPGTNILTKEWEDEEIEKQMWKMRGGVRDGDSSWNEEELV